MNIRDALIDVVTCNNAGPIYLRPVCNRDFEDNTAINVVDRKIEFVFAFECEFLDQLADTAKLHASSIKSLLPTIPGVKFNDVEIHYFNNTDDKRQVDIFINTEVD